MTFSQALELLKRGDHIARQGWNGKGMYLYLWQDLGFQPCIVMYTADKKHQPGWLASQADLLADDWVIVG